MPSRRPAEGSLGWLIAAAIAIGAIAQLTSIVQENQTWDESMHLAAGFSYLKTGDFRMNTEHPPLGKLLAGLPLLLTRARLPLEHPSWEARDQLVFAQTFLYKNEVAPDRLLLLGRLPTIFLTVCLGITLAWWTRREFGIAASLLAVFLGATDPNLIAHGRYVTTDLIAALGFFVSVTTWVRYLYKPRWTSLVVTGLALGFALVSKFSSILLLPMLFLLYLIRWFQTRKERRLWFLNLLKSFAVIGVISAVVVMITYWPETVRVSTKRLAESVDRNDSTGYLFHRLGKALRLPPHPYLIGLYNVAKHNAEGHDSYVLGKHLKKGAWYYFPVAFAVKTPTAVLLLILLAPPAIFFRRKEPGGEWFRWIAMLLPIAIYFGLSMTSGINIGVRHLLPIYPFLFVLLAGAVMRIPWRAAIAAAVVVIQIAEVGAIHPHYLAFFNSLAGGPKAGPYYLADSNIDWGQDLKKLKRYMDKQGLPSVCLAYFGSAEVHHYGISERHLPWTSDVKGRDEIDCVAVIGVTLLRDVYLPPGSYEWLRQKTPVDHIGHSMWVYDLRKPR